MPWFEYDCLDCRKRFEQIISYSERETGTCPSCGGQRIQLRISRFAVGGQGDLRESTLHGCHGCHSGHNHGGNGGAAESAGESIGGDSGGGQE